MASSNGFFDFLKNHLITLNSKLKRNTNKAKAPALSFDQINIVFMYLGKILYETIVGLF